MTLDPAAMPAPSLWGRPFPFSIRDAGLAAHALVCCVLLFAGIAKALDLDGFIVELRAWAIVPDRLAAVLAGCVIAVENVVPFFWLRVRSLALSTVVVTTPLVLFTLGYGLESILAEPPTCSCFGEIVKHQVKQASVGGYILRNGILLTIAVAPLLVSLACRLFDSNSSKEHTG